jgi:Bacterial protein of unknown function (DUF899)
LAHVTRREHAGDARLERQGFTILVPVHLGSLEKVATGDEVTLLVALDLVGQPLGVWFGGRRGGWLRPRDRWPGALAGRRGSGLDREYVFDTQEGKKTVAELFDGRSQQLAYNIMYGGRLQRRRLPRVHEPRRRYRRYHAHSPQISGDVTVICFSRAPIDRLTA